MAWARDLRLAVGPKGGRLITYSKFERALDHTKPPAKDGDVKGSRKMIRDYLAGRTYPHWRNAWACAAALYHGDKPGSGIRAYSGPRGLFVSGHLADFFGILGRFLLGKSLTREGFSASCLRFWRLLESIVVATQWRDIYAIPEVARVCVLGDAATEDERLDALAKIRAHDERARRFPTQEHAFCCYLFARRAWTFSPAETAHLEQAKEGWERHRTPAHPRSGMDQTLENAITIAKNRHQPYEERVTLTLAMVMEMLSSEFSDAQVQEAEAFSSELEPPGIEIPLRDLTGTRSVEFFPGVNFLDALEDEASTDW